MAVCTKLLALRFIYLYVGCIQNIFVNEKLGMELSSNHDGFRFVSSLNIFFFYFTVGSAERGYKQESSRMFYPDRNAYKHDQRFEPQSNPVFQTNQHPEDRFNSYAR